MMKKRPKKKHITPKEPVLPASPISQCAWCWVILSGPQAGENPGKPLQGASHSICQDCMKRYFPQYAEKVGDDPLDTSGKKG
jgi:hypothetical protein